MFCEEWFRLCDGVTEDLAFADSPLNLAKVLHSELTVPFA